MKYVWFALAMLLALWLLFPPEKKKKPWQPEEPMKIEAVPQVEYGWK